MTRKIGNGSIPLRIGRLIDTTVYGGPYRDVPKLYWGVKMAVEINHPHMVAVDTKDFDVPKVSDLQAGIVRALMAMMNDEDVYVGCMGGIGRTGLFLAALAKVQIEYRKTKHRAGRGDDPVLYVRRHFIPHAVETQQQQDYIADFDVSNIVDWLQMTQVTMGTGGMTPARNIADLPTVDESHEAWVAEEDKIGKTEYNHYQAEWKVRRDSRNTDWMDSPVADSATEYAPEDTRMDSMQNQIDELRQDILTVVAVARGTIDRIDEHNDRFKLVADMIKKGLTNQTWSGKIRSIFS